MAGKKPCVVGKDPGRKEGQFDHQRVSGSCEGKERMIYPRPSRVTLQLFARSLPTFMEYEQETGEKKSPVNREAWRQKWRNQTAHLDRREDRELAYRFHQAQGNRSGQGEKCSGIGKQFHRLCQVLFSPDVVASSQGLGRASRSDSLYRGQGREDACATLSLHLRHGCALGECQGRVGNPKPEQYKIFLLLRWLVFAGTRSTSCPGVPSAGTKESSGSRQQLFSPQIQGLGRRRIG